MMMNQNDYFDGIDEIYEALIKRIEQQIEQTQAELEKTPKDAIANRNFDRGYLQGLLTAQKLIQAEFEIEE